MNPFYASRSSAFQFAKILATVFALLAGSAVCAVEASDGDDQTAAETQIGDVEFFEKKIRPVLVRHCYECHSDDAKIVQGGLWLDSRKGIRKGGESGPSVAPGKVDESLLIDALKYDGLQMPPKGKLPAAVVADFKKWIERGAVDPRVGKSAGEKRTIDLDEARRFWSFQPIRRPDPPEIAAESVSTSPVDRFLRTRLEQNALRSAPPADRRMLCRRVYFDLVGMPPAPAELDAFLNDDAPDSFARLVDRLLASPHFGERWGRHWLDVVRFAESTGGGRTKVLDNAWRYRDYVIRAYNEDKPFDRFIAENLAGDLLSWETTDERRDNLTGTSFLVLGPTNYELQDKELLRMEVVDEQMDVMGRVFLGMTIGCARCHDHKFDPIPNTDYYALAGIFRSTKTLLPGNVSGYVERSLPVSKEHDRAVALHREKVKPVEEALAAAKAELKTLGAVVGGAKSVKASSLPGVVVDEGSAELTGAWASSSAIGEFVGTEYRYAGRGNASATYTIRIEKPGRYEVRISHNAHPNRARNALVTVTHADGDMERRINQRKTPPIDGLFTSLGTFRFTKDQPVVVVLSCKDAIGSTIADAVQVLPAEQPAVEDAASILSDAGSVAHGRDSEAKKRPARNERRTVLVKTVKRLEAELAALKKSAPAEGPKVMSVHEEQAPGDYRICIRGNVHKLGDVVPRGVLSVVETESPVEIPADVSGRLELARWVGSRDNPLTARVYVNRVWHHLFGSGIVRTVDNFGVMGERPSHPELLDWLANELIRSGWSTKHVVRTIVLSDAYRQSSGPVSGSETVDPENRLFHRMNRKRLEAEAIRDAMFAAGGGLRLRMYGPEYKTGTKSEFGFIHQSDRRSVYTPVFRNSLHPLFWVFDAADPNLVSGKRNVSTLPTQALYLMNSPLAMDQSTRAARRLLSMNANDRERIAHAYRLTLSRPPTPEELELAVEFLGVDANDAAAKQSQELNEDRVENWSRFVQALFASVDFRYAD